jgi:hypothetical protein
MIRRATQLAGVGDAQLLRQAGCGPHAAETAPSLGVPRRRKAWDGRSGAWSRVRSCGTGSPTPRNMRPTRLGSSLVCARRACWVRVRFSETNLGQVTGYAVALVGHPAEVGAPRWYGGGRLAAELTLPQLRHRWDREHPGAGERSGTLRFTAPERDMLYRHAARQAAAATEHIRRRAGHHPDAAADAAWAAAATFDTAAQVIHDPALLCAADAYDRAARVPHGRIPCLTPVGDRLRATARLIALVGDTGGDDTALAGALTANLAALAVAVTELRQAQKHAAQAAAARNAAEHMHTAMTRARSPVSQPGRPQRPRRPRSASAGDAARQDFPMPLRLDQALLTAVSTTGAARPGRGHQPPTRAGPDR